MESSATARSWNGYCQFNPAVTLVAVIAIVVIVQVAQFAGNVLARKVLRR